ncbi:hypothetical protein B4U79_07674 [Dinothrombium tinctorium]|uniref:Uncharacterized protein n=1 Tax=Dinothrombium tinctorium TaxID=1965070 RepID=A0A443Q7V0_9ACAR|nr:hypothetical protein B4U79_07674 [Dinothrombium tinctorium]
MYITTRQISVTMCRVLFFSN